MCVICLPSTGTTAPYIMVRLFAGTKKKRIKTTKKKNKNHSALLMVRRFFYSLSFSLILVRVSLLSHQVKP